jgi:hypothetical protein
LESVVDWLLEGEGAVGLGQDRTVRERRGVDREAACLSTLLAVEVDVWTFAKHGLH